MKIIHTADLHIGQIIYQNYDRNDEHQHFFRQLEEWCKAEKPDALLISGDVFDIQQPSASTKRAFTEYFVQLHQSCPDMCIVITAGNHDSASRIQADSAVWKLANTYLVGTSPSLELLETDTNWQDNYIVALEKGFIVALPYMIGERREQIQSILDRVEAMNQENKPVILMGHLAITGLDATGHDFEIGKIKTQEIASLGTGYDYLALGHIHKPQTIGHQADAMKEEVSYPSPVIRYSGSALHVSCDETYPHSVSVVETDQHNGTVHIKQLRIDELRHFYVLPLDGSSFASAEEALEAVKAFAQENHSGYIRLKMDYKAAIPSNFNQLIYDLLESHKDEIRYNPKIVWTGKPANEGLEQIKPTFEVAELQQMTDPMCFIERTRDQYPELDLEEVRMAFEEIKEEVHRMAEAEKLESKSKKKTKESTK